VLFLATGVGATVFGILLLRGDGGILGQHAQLHPVYAWVAVGITVIIPALFTLFAYVLPLQVLRVIGASVTLGFVAVQLMWIPAMVEPTLWDDRNPWLQGFTGLHATIAAVVWQHRLVWLYPILQVPIITLTQMGARADSTREAILDGVGGLLFGLILMGVATAVLAAADRQDDAATRARSQASAESSRHTREREQTRINAMVHDDVMSVLLAASRPTQTEGLASQASLALTRIEQLTSTQMDERLYPPEEVVAVLRSTLFDYSSAVTYDYQLDGTATVPAPVMAALTEAVSEALRNSMQHADGRGRAVDRSVNVVVGDSGVGVTVHDNGVGFARRQVSERRLGVRVSIIGRMRSLLGGDAQVTSKPGRGTTVHLSWTRP
jgi:signal transduction histidine kinase